MLQRRDDTRGHDHDDQRGVTGVQSGTLDGVTVNGVLDVGNSINGAQLTVTNGLVLNGTALVGNPTNSSSGNDHLCGEPDA